jgi:hypothetical protein
MKQGTRKRPDMRDMSDDDRAFLAEMLRERIYATITLLAVVAALWQHPDEHQPLGAIGVILGTVVALWLATLVAARISYTAVHGHRVHKEPKYLEASKAASGLLTPASTPILFILISMTGLFSLKTALFIGVLSLLASLFFFSAMSGNRATDSKLKLLVFSSMQTLIGVGVVLLKLAVE